jgi:hypothetical protein
MTLQDIYNAVKTDMSYATFISSLKEHFLPGQTKEINPELDELADDFCKMFKIEKATLKLKSQNSDVVFYRMLFAVTAQDRFINQEIADYVNCGQSNISIMTRRFIFESNHDARKANFILRAKELNYLQENDNR